MSFRPFPFQELLEWYKIHGRNELPWRDYSFDKKQLWYRVWLAETMLQQTQVERVKDYFHNILTAFPTIENLAAASYDDFFPYYKWLWYYSRARNMLKAAAMVVNEYDGVFPTESSELQKLPGVWPYTAEAIRAFTYNIPTLSFDTNLEKIFSRYYFWNRFQKLTKQEKEDILRDFKQSNISSRDINNALMDYWATISLNNISGIKWDDYPLTTSEFYITQGSLEPIKEKKKSTFPIKQSHVIAILHENHKIYFSESSEFSPFYIGKNSWNSRALVQDFFQKKLDLEVSVRPPEVKSYTSKEIPYMICYVQIQKWTHSLQSFERLKVRGHEESYIEQMNFDENISLF